MLSALTLTGSLFCATALAQTHICLGGDLDHLTKTQKDHCTARLQEVRKAAAALHAPEGWHFVVVCGEEGWKAYADYSLRQDTALQHAVVDTDYAAHETFLRESALESLTSSGSENILSREIADILTHVPAQANTGL